MDVDRIRSFDRSSPVHAYWLSRCEGFEVRAGKESGVVEDVALDSSNQALYLVVRFGVARRREVPPSAVESVVPAEELLVVEAPEAPPARVAPAAREVASKGRSGLQAGATASRSAATRVGRATGAAGAVAWSKARSSAVASGHGSRRLSVWLAPRVRTALEQVGWAIHFALAWTAVGAATVADRVSRHGPPAARAAGGAVAAAAAGLRARAPSVDIRPRPRPAPPRPPRRRPQQTSSPDEPTVERIRDLTGAGRSRRKTRGF